MRKYLVIFSLFFGMLVINNCYAGEPYIGVIAGGSGGFNIKDSKLDTTLGYYLGGRLGFKFFSLFRLEEEFSYQHSGVHSIKKEGFKLHHVRGHVNFWSLMTNILFDLNCPFIITPYFGGGIGYARGDGHGVGKFSFHEKHEEQKFHQNEFAWQIVVGLKYFICFGLETSLEYRYFKVTEANVNHKLGLALTKFF